ncbi:MAG: hypothetical protein FJX75_06620 [Armatimonadetes bacterium]|nr:hypothetical protein [Armatimonadota bacterium]
MDALHVVDGDRDPAGPCACGSALPRSLCCGARAPVGRNGPAVFAADESADAVAEEWDLALTTIHALAPVLPDVAVPLLGNRTPRELFHAGAEERSAALQFVQAVSRSADGMGFELPTDHIVASLAAADPPTYAPEEREGLVLASFTLQLLARGVETAAVLGGQRLFRDLIRATPPALEDPHACAAAVDFAVCWMHFRPEANEEYPEGRREIAALYEVVPEALLEHFGDLKKALKLVWFDPRYAVQDPAWQERLERTARAIAEGDLDDDLAK